MGNMFGMFSFAFWVIRALKCEAVNFPKFELRWHDIIGVHIVGTPHHHGLHRMGMTKA